MEKSLFKLKGDKGIWIILVFFAMISILSVFSASSFLASDGGTSKTAIFLEQTRSVLLGFAALFICYLIPLKWYRFLSFFVFGASVLMLIMLYIPGLRDERNGAVRGLKVAGHTVQVFEIVKVGMILYIAKALELWEDSLYTMKDFMLKLALPILGVCVMVLPNSVSSALLIGGVSVLILFFMNVRWQYILAMIGIVFAAGLLMYGTYCAAYKGKAPENQPIGAKLFNRFGTVENRFANFFSDEEIDESTLTAKQRMVMLDEKRQSENAKVAISEGGLLGKGPGKSTQRYSLSMAFSDFIFAFIVEEYGLAGGIVVIGLYVVLLFRCIRLCTRCNTTYTGAVVVGIAFLITAQALLHILVNVRLLPITGHTLPLISHGGTAYLILSGAFGILLSVNKQLDKQDEELAARIELENQQIGNTNEKPEDNY